MFQAIRGFSFSSPYISPRSGIPDGSDSAHKGVKKHKLIHSIIYGIKMS